MQRMCHYIASKGPIYMLRIKKCTNTRYNAAWKNAEEDPMFARNKERRERVREDKSV